MSTFTDRIAITLVKTGPLPTLADSTGVIRSATYEVIPYAIDGTQYLDYTAVNTPRSSGSDTQISRIIDYITKVPNVGNAAANSAGFVKTYRDRYEHNLKTQALAIIALSRFGDYTNAEKIIKALNCNTLKTDHWLQSYDQYGSTLNSAVKIEDNAWAAIALMTFQKYSGITTYQNTAMTVLDYLNSLRVPVTIRATASTVHYAKLTNTNEINTSANFIAFSSYKYYDTVTSGSRYLTTRNQLLQHLNIMRAEKAFYPSVNVTTGMDISPHYLMDQIYAYLLFGETGTNGEKYDQGIDFNCQYFYETAGHINGNSGGIKGFYEQRNPKTTTSNPFVWGEGTAAMTLAFKQISTNKSTNYTCQGLTQNEWETYWLGKLNDGVAFGASIYSSPDYYPQMNIDATAWTYFMKNNYNPLIP